MDTNLVLYLHRQMRKKIFHDVNTGYYTRVGTINKIAAFAAISISDKQIKISEIEL